MLVCENQYIRKTGNPAGSMSNAPIPDHFPLQVAEHHIGLPVELTECGQESGAAVVTISDKYVGAPPPIVSKV